MELKKNIIEFDTHGIANEQVSQNTMTILNTLRDAGHQAYIVGGAVRDLLLGKKPKDFDIVTSAKPDQVKALFKRCALIGKRFVLAHVYIQDQQPTEVSTFRKTPNVDLEESTDNHQVNEEGRILKGNCYGESIEDDVVHRDFTINALYYDPIANQIVDLVNGYQDCIGRNIVFINQNNIESIKEDPARIIRIIRFSQVLQCPIKPELEKLISEHVALLNNIPPARRMVELVKMFHSGYGVQSYEQLEKYKMIELLFGNVTPALDHEEEHPIRKFVRIGLENTDDRILKKNHTSKAFLMAVLYWPYAMARSEYSLPPTQNLHLIGKELFASFLRGLPKVHQDMLLTIWSLQNKFRETLPEQIPQFCRQRYFRAAYDFYVLRVQSGLESEQKLELWTQSRDQYAPANQENKFERGSHARRRPFGNGNKRFKNRKNGRGGNKSSSSNPNKVSTDQQYSQSGELVYDKYNSFDSFEPEAEKTIVTSNKFNLLDS
ncbi:MAG: polynucleotide adenylyltransferase PcnB [Methylacidiphilales bacterium]|nr:polynucleotide adenylyltransferase PcnB [Candidatus Methylacidiphilales bacterium]